MNLCRRPVAKGVCYWIIEVVTKPSASLPGENWHRREVMWPHVTNILEALHRAGDHPGVSLEDALRDTGLRVTDAGRGARLWRLIADRPIAVYPQFTVGVPVRALFRFLEWLSLDGRTPDYETFLNLKGSLDFGRAIASLYLEKTHGYVEVDDRLLDIVGDSEAYRGRSIVAWLRR